MLQPQTKKTQPGTPLPRRKLLQGIDFHRFLLRIRMDNYKKMIDAGLAWGDITEFMNDAIREKLERMEKNGR